MGMSVARSDKLRRRVLENLRDLASSTIFYGLSHDEYIQRYMKIREPLKGTPEYIRSYVSGYAERIQEEFYKEMVYCHINPDDGKLYSLHRNEAAMSFVEDVNPLYKRGFGQSLSQWDHAHFWISASIREIGYGRPAKRY